VIRSNIRNKNVDKWLDTFKRKVLGRLFGGIKVRKNWRKRYNKKLMQMFGGLDKLSFVRLSLVQLDW
jgi:hypothetical protein